MDARQILPTIVNPVDLHKLSDKELHQVAREVRQTILDKVSQTGGHLSSNLGTVELTVALYAAYSLPPDKVIWDTGHQAYPHKMLTGRSERFDTLRKYKGLSGFLKRDENPHDVFGAGHAGTAISAGLGFAMARDQLGTKERVVAITGDAAICSGMSWEALNHAGEAQTDLTIVLNDNRMSIAPNVGALTKYFTRLRSRPDLQGAAHRAKGMVERIGGPLERMAAGFRHGLTHYFAPEEAGTIFEEMGLEYIGPVDGHDLDVMLEIFRNVRQLPGPVFVHAMTVKGKGYEASEEDSRKWHGVVPFDLESQEMRKAAGPISFTQAFGDAAAECAQEDSKVVAITAAMPDGTGLNRFQKEFPERYYDVGIAEQHGVTLAAGLAAGGLKPFCAIYSTFMQRGFDQVLHDVAIQKLPVRFFMDRAGLVGDDGPTHHGAFDISFMNCIPNMVLLAPRDTTELREMTHWMRTFDAGPSAVRYPRGSSDDRLPEARSPIQLGKSEVLCEGSELLIVAVGSMVADAYVVGKELGATVINARFIKPLDTSVILERARQCGRVLIVEENVRMGGFGQMVRDSLCDAGLGHLPSAILALPDAFVEHGAQPLIRRDVGLDQDGILRVARELKAIPSHA